MVSSLIAVLQFPRVFERGAEPFQSGSDARLRRAEWDTFFFADLERCAAIGAGQDDGTALLRWQP
jgi:hypothetical protein